MQGILEQNKIANSIIDRTDGAFGKKIGFIGSLFGCWHKELSRPFTIETDSYRSCLCCGARRQFDIETLKTFGSFHYPPAISWDNSANNN